MPTKSYNGPYVGPQGPVSLSERQRIAEAVVGVVEWGEDGSWGYCACPGADLHTGKTARRDCRIFTGLRGEAQESPNVYCLHTSCLAPIEAASTRLRSLIGKAKAASGRALPPTPSSDPRSVRQVRHTARTGNFGLAEEKRGSSAQPVGAKEAAGTEFRTLRTDETRPLTRFAHVRTRPHDLPEVPSHPSEPYVKPPAPVQPKVPAVAQQTPEVTRVSLPVDAPKQAEDAGRVFCPVRLVWITRAQWAEELKAKPLSP